MWRRSAKVFGLERPSESPNYTYPLQPTVIEKKTPPVGLL